jgi:hypothetical protein
MTPKMPRLPDGTSAVPAGCRPARALSRFLNASASLGRKQGVEMTFKSTLAAGVVLSALGAAFLPGTPAYAVSGTPDEQKACRPDVARHCKGLQADDENAFVGCLVNHAPQLSQRCRRVLEAHGKLPPR